MFGYSHLPFSTSETPLLNGDILNFILYISQNPSFILNIQEQLDLILSIQTQNPDFVLNIQEEFTFILNIEMDRVFII
jgi:hypothetical protein